MKTNKTTPAQIKPCKQCRSTAICFSDANYSSFNIGGGCCSSCGYEVVATCGCMPLRDELIQIWNAGQKLSDSEKLANARYKSRQLRKQIRALGHKPIA